MCTHYTPTRHDKLAYLEATGKDLDEWHHEAWPDYKAPIVRHTINGTREAVLGNYGMIPKAKMPPGVKRFSTVNARAETIGELRSYSKQWREGRLCLVLMEDFFEPCYETGSAVNWRIGLQDVADFAVAGLYKEWPEEDGFSYSFTQITINADEHPVMRRFHKPSDEKRSLVILRPEDWDEWLSCRNPEFARAFLQPYPPELMQTQPAPLPPRTKRTAV